MRFYRSNPNHPAKPNRGECHLCRGPMKRVAGLSRDGKVGICEECMVRFESQSKADGPETPKP
jgi:hypothetical protein